MRIYVTGGSGFVGSNLVEVFEAHGAEILAPRHVDVELTDAGAVARSVADFRPDAIVHTAIWNALGGLLSDRRKAWDNFVPATRNVVDAANAAGAQVVLISTDWVFDGTQGPAREADPPNPINTYGFLKAMSELVVADRAERGTVARVAGVQGVHKARSRTEFAQNAGFGYLVATVFEELHAGRRFTVWEDPRLNSIATPTLATDAGEMIWRALERGVTGTLHCCGGEHIDRVAFARRAVGAFGLDEALLDVGPPDPAMLGSGAAPYDTSLDATRTAAALGVELPSIDQLLARLRVELEATWMLCPGAEEQER
jgi:dTDP-4-dehydrorhamnose reductase